MSSFIPNPKLRKTSKIINTRTITIRPSIFFFSFFFLVRIAKAILVFTIHCVNISQTPNADKCQRKALRAQAKARVISVKNMFIWTKVWLRFCLSLSLSFTSEKVPWTLLFPLEGHSLFQLFFSFAIYFGKEMRFYALADQSNF